MQCDVSEEEQQANDGGLVFRRATNLGQGKVAGTLVFTGQPTDYSKPRAKKRDFIFLDEESSEPPIPVSRELQREFEQIHSQGERHGEPQPNEDWAFFRKWLAQGRRVPVFYLEDAPSGLAFGLAQMFRLPYRLSLHEAIANTHEDHLDERPDLADLIFGFVRKHDRDALRGRVSFEPLWSESTPVTEQPTEAVLMGPRPSFYPYYVAQPTEVNQQTPYATLMRDDAELAGWKRYPVRPPAQVRKSAGNGTDGVKSLLEPLAPGATFAGRVHVHNLRPAELGAVLWAITWGDRASHRHALGMGKPLGFGQVRLEIVAHNLESVAGMPVSAEQFAGLVRAFEEHMEQAVGRGQNDGWSKSEQIFHLLSLADPSSASGQEAALTHPVLDSQGRRNDFVQIKKGFQVLRPLCDFTGRPDRVVRPRKSPEEKNRERQRRQEAAAQVAREQEASERRAAEDRTAAARAAEAPATRFREDSRDCDAGNAWGLLKRETSLCVSGSERTALLQAAREHHELRELMDKWNKEEAQTPVPGSTEFAELSPKKQEKAKSRLENLQLIRRLERGEPSD